MSVKFYDRLAEAARGGPPAWLATVITSTGSTPARAGMKMIILGDGNIDGTIGGGALERIVLEKVRGESPSTVQRWSFDLGAESGAGLSTPMECGGVEEVLVEPLSSGPPLFIFGGGHCGVALSRLAAWTGFAVTVYDNRAEWASAVKHPDARRTVCAPYDDVLAHVGASADAFAVIMTHGHQHDETVLRQLVKHPWRYLGMIGSARKVGVVFENMRKDGFTPGVLSHVSSPVGFAIGSHTPEEIAVSIVAQMIAVRNGVVST